MKSQLSAMDLYYLIKELKVLEEAKIDKIYSLSKKKIIINMHVPSKGKRQLFIDAEKTLFLTKFKFPTDTPSEFCMYLRKKLNNARLRNISQIGFERILNLEFETKESRYNLILELFSKGNILLLKDNKVLIASEYQKWKDRTIKPKSDYDYPKKEYDFSSITENQMRDLFSSTNKESVIKSLAIDLGLGGIYAEELINLSGLEKDKDRKPSELGNKKIEKIYKAANDLKSKKLDPQIIYEKDFIKDITPFRLEYYSDKKSEPAESFSNALDNYFSNLSISKQREKSEKKLEEIRSIIDQQKQTIKNLEKSEIENKEKGDKLYEKYELVSGLLKELSEISKDHSMQEIKEKLKGHKIIKDVNPKDKTIVVDI